MRGGKRLLEITQREHALTIVPRPPGMHDKQYKKLMSSKLGQQRLWRELGQELGPEAELDPKGGLVVAAGPASLSDLRQFAAAQAACGDESAAAATLSGTPADSRPTISTSAL